MPVRGPAALVYEPLQYDPVMVRWIERCYQIRPGQSGRRAEIFIDIDKCRPFERGAMGSNEVDVSFDLTMNDIASLVAGLPFGNGDIEAFQLIAYRTGDLFIVEMGSIGGIVVATLVEATSLKAAAVKWTGLAC